VFDDLQIVGPPASRALMRTNRGSELPTCLASGSTLCTAEGRPVASCSTWIQA
jgi:hypothetical protein